MSKIGRKLIDLDGIAVTVQNQELHYKGKKHSGIYHLPDVLTAHIADGKLQLRVNESIKNKKELKNVNKVWGLNRALLVNTLKGSNQDFEKKLEINGLGFKAALSGSNIVFTLGFSHKINFELPKEVTLELDKTGQKLLFKSPNKELLGLVCSQIRALRPPEPYKGTGIKYSSEEIMRKAGKTKSA